VIAALLLAAGRSTRFGGDKLLAPLHGRPVLFWSAAAIAPEVDALYVVVPADAPARVTAMGGIRCVVVEHPGRDAGMASSIAAGIAALAPEVDAVVIALADQPLAAPEVVRQLCARWREGGVAAVVPCYQDGRGNPVLFGRSSFEALGALAGDIGARIHLQALGDTVAVVPVDGTAPLDVDTPDALGRLATVWPS
jgi:molybdenum cofactor cytidylyltransferase